MKKFDIFVILSSYSRDSVFDFRFVHTDSRCIASFSLFHRFAYEKKKYVVLCVRRIHFVVDIGYCVNYYTIHVRTYSEGKLKEPQCWNFIIIFICLLLFFFFSYVLLFFTFSSALILRLSRFIAFCYLTVATKKKQPT